MLDSTFRDTERRAPMRVTAENQHAVDLVVGNEAQNGLAFSLETRPAVTPLGIHRERHSRHDELKYYHISTSSASTTAWSILTGVTYLECRGVLRQQPILQILQLQCA